mmetsp:Transcript_1685/g.4602  ORF Transcript_1685/g.4602 Transcript_1685/m.4602 type:complete len:325 (-) Transcript_1685:124-1098(-)
MPVHRDVPHLDHDVPGAVEGRDRHVLGFEVHGEGGLRVESVEAGGGCDGFGDVVVGAAGARRVEIRVGCEGDGCELAGGEEEVVLHGGDGEVDGGVAGVDDAAVGADAGGVADGVDGGEVVLAGGEERVEEEEVGADADDVVVCEFFLGFVGLDRAPAFFERGELLDEDAHSQILGERGGAHGAGLPSDVARGAVLLVEVGIHRLETRDGALDVLHGAGEALVIPQLHLEERVRARRQRVDEPRLEEPVDLRDRKCADPADEADGDAGRRKGVEGAGGEEEQEDEGNGKGRRESRRARKARPGKVAGRGGKGGAIGGVPRTLRR